ncbi:unnamed protein product [Dicrocoelium dendriticum]|nr:unnamed protein product [Dicrocoelium dendriticum]
MKKPIKAQLKQCHLEPVEKTVPRPLPGVPEHFNHGVFFDDGFDYMQYLKSVSELNDRQAFRITGIPENESVTLADEHPTTSDIREPVVDEPALPEGFDLPSDLEDESTELEDNFVEIAGGKPVLCGDSDEADDTKHEVPRHIGASSRDKLSQDKVLMMERFLYGDNVGDQEHAAFPDASDESSPEWFADMDDNAALNYQFEKLVLRCKNRAKSASQSAVTSTSMMSEGLLYGLSRDKRILPHRSVENLTASATAIGVGNTTGSIGGGLTAAGNNLWTKLPHFCSKVKTKSHGYLFGNRKVKYSHRNHSLTERPFERPVECGVCGQLLWGLSPQGLACNNCDLCVHSKCKLGIREACTKENRKSGIPNAIPITTTNGTQSPPDMPPLAPHAVSCTRTHSFAPTVLSTGGAVDVLSDGITARDESSFALGARENTPSPRNPLLNASFGALNSDELAGGILNVTESTPSASTQSVSIRPSTSDIVSLETSYGEDRQQSTQNKSIGDEQMDTDIRKLQWFLPVCHPGSALLFEAFSSANSYF